MLNIGAGELIFILVVALLVLGPQRLPEFARTIGKYVREFRRQTDEVRTVVEREFYKMDQQFLDEPRPQVPGPIPAAKPAVLPSAAATSPLTPAVPEEGAQAVPEGVQTVTVEAVTAEAAPGSEALAEAPSPTSPEPAAAGAGKEEGLPRLEPIPGTVARNAPKNG